MFGKRTGIVFIDKPPLLTDSQVVVVSEILRNIALLLFGSIILPFVLADVDKPTLFIVGLALTATFVLYAISIIIVRNTKP